MILAQKLNEMGDSKEVFYEIPDNETIDTRQSLQNKYSTTEDLQVRRV